MSGGLGHMIWAAVGAVVGGGIAMAVVPSLFWACLICGALMAGALRVGFVLMSSESDQK